jgi:ATP synthase protein I
MTATPLRKMIQLEAYQLVLWQLACVCGIAVIACLLCGIISGYSVLAGGLAYGIPNLLFVWRVFRYAGAQQMTQFMAAFFFGEMIKLILSGILFLLVVKYLPVSLLSVLAGFVGAIVSFWVVCIFSFSKQDNSRRKGVAR